MPVSDIHTLVCININTPVHTPEKDYSKVWSQLLKAALDFAAWL